jgi:surface polysaccharide O-acyltransferase-like enzyme
VVTIHSLFSGAHGIAPNTQFVALAGLGVAVPVFMLLSGVLAGDELTRRPASVAIGRRLIRLLPLYVVWTCVYVAIAHLSGGSDLARLRGSSALSVLVFGGAWYHLYFLPALLQLLLVLPLLMVLARSRVLARAGLVVGTVFLALGPVLSGSTGLDSHGRHHHLLVVLFSSPYIFVWLPYGLAAAAIAVGTLRVTRPALWLAAGVIVFTLEGFEALAAHVPSTSSYARGGLLLAAVGAFALARRWASPPRWLVWLGRYSLGVFLVHPVLLWALRPVIPSPMPLWLLPILVAGVVALSAGLVAVVSHTPARFVFDGRLPQWAGLRRRLAEQGPSALGSSPVAQSDRPWTRVTPPWAVAATMVLAAALVLRLGLVAATRGMRLVNDPADYFRLAVSIAHGHGFGQTVVAPGGGPTAFRPPLYPLALGAFFKVFGVSVTGARVAQALLGTLTVALVGVLVRQLWGRRTALVAMAIAAVYPPLLLAGGALLSESIALPLELAGLIVVLRARSSSRPWAWLAGAGVLAGLGILDRPDSVVLLLPLCLLAWARDRRSWRKALPAGLVVLAALVTVTPWLIRDAVVMGRFIPLTTQSGLVASGTYNDAAAHDSSSPAAWRPSNLVPEYLPLLRGTEYQENQALDTASVNYLEHHPTYLATVTFWNTVRLFELRGPSGTRASWAANGYGGTAADLAFAGFCVVAALALAGATTRAARRAPWALWLTPVLVTASTVVVLGESRLRALVDPFLVILAALAVVAAINRLQARRVTRTLGP